MWAVIAAMRVVAAVSWTFTSSMWAAHPLCGLLQPLCGLKQLSCGLLQPLTITPAGKEKVKNEELRQRRIRRIRINIGEKD